MLPQMDYQRRQVFYPNLGRAFVKFENASLTQIQKHFKELYGAPFEVKKVQKQSGFSNFVFIFGLIKNQAEWSRLPMRRCLQRRPFSLGSHRVAPTAL